MSDEKKPIPDHNELCDEVSTLREEFNEVRKVTWDFLGRIARLESDANIMKAELATLKDQIADLKKFKEDASKYLNNPSINRGI